jgi:hypothetical protein
LIGREPAGLIIFSPTVSAEAPTAAGGASSYLLDVYRLMRFSHKKA